MQNIGIDIHAATAQDKALLVQAPDFWFNRDFRCKAETSQEKAGA